MAEDAFVSFTIKQEGSCQGRPDKHFTLKAAAGKAVRIGRAPGNDVVIEFRGISQYHAELRLAAKDGTYRLCVRDLSMNGTGLQRPESKVPVTLTKQVDEPLHHDAVLLVPMMLKADASPSERALLRVEFDNEEEANGVGEAPADTKEDGAKAPGKEGNGAAANGSDEEQGEDATEKKRMMFVDLLLKTKEVNASTAYEDARGLLSEEAAWKDVDEDTRKECFEIFVEHLGSHSKKKDKKGGKKDKDKGKKKKKDEDRNDEKRRKGDRSGSEEKGRKGRKKGGRGSDDGSRSRSAGDRRRKRRRGHSSD
mmetsp:Transcript_56354/g.145079  ORF Transcript_56354/g.145079 Transcript_56354/m.145079 type:complete len:309 (-) Transcript_56354:133-1059(-)